MCSGKVSGDIAKLILSRGGKAAVVIGSLKIAGHNDRVCGFLSSISENPSIEVVEQLENQDDDAISYRAISELLSAQSPDLIYFGAAGIEGGIKAVLESQKDIRIITVDDTETVRKYLRRGVISATVTQQPFVQGNNSIKILFDYLSNKTTPREINNYTKNQVLLKNSK